jgi:hypothetical protein
MSQIVYNKPSALSLTPCISTTFRLAVPGEKESANMTQPNQSTKLPQNGNSTSSQHTKPLGVDEDQYLGVDKQRPLGVEIPFWWTYSQVFPNFHHSNTTYKPRLRSMKNEDEQQKYELVLVETAVLVFHSREHPSELLVLDEVFTKDDFPKVPLDLCECICKAVSQVYGIDLHKTQMVSHISKVSVL